MTTSTTATAATATNSAAALGYTGTTPVSLTLSGDFSAAAAMIVDPYHGLTPVEMEVAIAECLRALASTPC